MGVESYILDCLGLDLNFRFIFGLRSGSLLAVSSHLYWRNGRRWEGIKCIVLISVNLQLVLCVACLLLELNLVRLELRIELAHVASFVLEPFVHHFVAPLELVAFWYYFIYRAITMQILNKFKRRINMSMLEWVFLVNL